MGDRDRGALCYRYPMEGSVHGRKDVRYRPIAADTDSRTERDARLLRATEWFSRPEGATRKAGRDGAARFMKWNESLDSRAGRDGTAAEDENVPETHPLAGLVETRARSGRPA